MSESMPKGEVDRLFAEMFDGGITVLDEDMFELNEFYRHLVNNGYSDEEIGMIFDLKIAEGEEL